MPAQFVNVFWKCEHEAMLVLARNKIKGATIIRTGPEAILYEMERRAYTAWMDDDHLTILRVDPGFPAEYV